MDANRGRGIRVDLSSPDVVIFIEVRGKTAYIIADRFPGPGGLPMGTQGRVVVLVDGENGAAAAWMMMKRGCRVIAAGFGDGAKEAHGIVVPWAPGIALHELPDVSMEALERFARRRRAEALVLGSTFEEMEKGIPQAGMPVLYPLCGLGLKDIAGLVDRIRAG